MKIRLSQTGGFAGVPIDLADIDTAHLSTRQAERLVRLAQDVLRAPAGSAAGDRPVGADVDVSYTLTIQHAGESRTVSFPDTGGGVITAARGTVRKLVSAMVEGGKS